MEFFSQSKVLSNFRAIGLDARCEGCLIMEFDGELEQENE
jgi:hypothetical protein